MMAITTNNSMSVNPERCCIVTISAKNENREENGHGSEYSESVPDTKASAKVLGAILGVQAMKQWVCFLLPLVWSTAALAQDSQRKPEDLRLFDYKPRSMVRVLENPIERARFPAINMHTHIGGFRSTEQ